VLLLLNPAASSYSEHARNMVERRLGAVHDVAVQETEKRGHAADLAASAARDGVDVVAVLAGDGTLNEAAVGLAATTTALAALPGGSTNVFARTLGIAYDPVRAVDALLASLAAGSFLRIGLGIANGRHFLFHLGAGFDAAVVSEIEERPEVKRYLAHPAFAIATVDTWLRRYDRRTRIRADIIGSDDSSTRVGEGPFAVVSNSDPYTYVIRRPIRIARQAALDRPLALTLVRTLRAWVMIRAAASSVARGRFVTTAPEIVQVADVDRLCLEADRPFPWQVDGEYLGETDHLDIHYEADTLTLVVPTR
jgi:diacylglycerol kinase family enzyme